LTLEELQYAVQALASQSQQQGEPRTKQIYQAIERRLRGLNLEQQGQLFYPVRTYLNRSIVYTDPEEMMRQGCYRHTLFHQLDVVERAITQGQGIELYRRADPYRTGGVGKLRVYPLQLMYAEVAWYLLYEQMQDGHLAIERVDRLDESLQVVKKTGRGIAAQQASLEVAHQLLRNGWGLFILR
jgi:hypothetical protein